VQLFLDTNTFITTKDDVTTSPMVLSTQGDSTGFPMNSNVLLILNPTVADTYGNYPNPFRAGTQSTTIEFYLPAASNVSIVLYDVLGERVLTLLDNQSLGTGLQRVLWDGRNGMGTYVLNGVYYAQLNVNGAQQLLKIAVVK
ncbi:MAG TPA: T9SS type A sorting domain-containing protein, partial [bacterium]